MIQTFERDGISFQFPENWSLELSESDDPTDQGWAAIIQSPETAFVLVSLRPAADNPADLADQTLEALKSEYKELDAENAVEALAGQAAVGHNVDFLTLDIATICWTRCLESLAGPILVLCQTSEFDRPHHEPILRAICASLKIDEE